MNITKIILEEANKLFPEGVGDKYAEKKFGIPDTEKRDYQRQTDAAVQSSPEMGELAGYVNHYGKTLRNEPIYLNPKSLRSFEADVRAMSDTEGNLYVAQHNGNFYHNSFFEVMGLDRDISVYDLSAGLTWHRAGTSNSFGFADSSADYENRFNTRAGNANTERVEQYYNNLNKLKERNTQFKFVPKYYENVEGE